MVADWLVVQGNDAGTAECFIFDDYAACHVATALQGHEIPDARIPLNVEIRAHNAPLADDCIVSNENEVPDARALADASVI
jgi:hypothetical protein